MGIESDLLDLDDHPERNGWGERRHRCGQRREWVSPPVIFRARVTGLRENFDKSSRPVFFDRKQRYIGGFGPTNWQGSSYTSPPG